MRVYTGQELERLRLIKHLVDDVGINLAACQRLLSVAEVVERMRPCSTTSTWAAPTRDSTSRANSKALSRILGL
jgi:DNA-binding transcriptional MerR regulator